MSIEMNLQRIQKEIPEGVTMVAVTKNRDVDAIQRVVDYGILDLGENRVQELLDKYDKVKGQVRWHLIGHLQSNKVKYIIDKVELIHSVDSIKLLKEIDRQAKKHGISSKVLIQVNVSKEETKSGIEVEEIQSFFSEIGHYPNVLVQGLMTMAPFTENSEETRQIFRKLNEIYVKIKNKQAIYNNVEMKYMSMGMTNDYPIAIEEGSNLVRIGRGIFI